MLWLLGLLIAVIPPRDSVSLDDLTHQFVGSNWSVVSQAKDRFEDEGAASLPILTGLLHRPEVVPLTETFDLIYPGAKTFYGHGEIVDYELDQLSVRAGWALEELTFE